ncbi:MAG: ATP-dependent DNA helicase RecG [Defluviitaleaceae bacterium]|nr:ATP-dependent DNA helicase RecG [Defluviitaleaceae bacterium]
MQINASVETLKNVGQSRREKLAALGVNTISDLIEYFPRDYQDRGRIVPICQTPQIPAGNLATVRGFFESFEQTERGNLLITKGYFRDNSGEIEVVWFNNPYILKNLSIGVLYVLSGKISKYHIYTSLQTPEYERFDAEKKSELLGIFPVYSLTQGLSRRILRPLIKQALDGTKDQIIDFLPQSIIKQHNLLTRVQAISNIHFPKSNDAYHAARRRLIFEELFLMQCAMLSLRTRFTKIKGYNFSNTSINEILDSLPFELTSSQREVIDEICQNLSSGEVMHRMIQGDVGSGKTAVAMVACYVAAKNGYQSAILAPTETLANQHYQTFCKIFEKASDFKIAKLTGSMKKSDKEKIKKDLTKGEIDIIIGTHAIIQENIKFARLALIVCDEQHRFGVRQRHNLEEKGKYPHMLVMSATPIPRSLAMSIHGDLDISIINQLPPGRQKIDTISVSSRYHGRIFKFIQGELEKGFQAYIICPLIDKSEKESMADIKAVNSLLKEIKEVFGDFKAEVLHGRMKPAEKNSIMESFAKGDINILLSTTVVEVGVDVPNATVMLIENAERFGLSQLHQLRGRVGRSGEKSYCILVTDSENETTQSRMDAMTSTSDGFELAELDLKLRGPGELFGYSQHGLPTLRISDLYRDAEILKETKDAASKFLCEDTDFSNLSNKEFALLKLEIDRILSDFGRVLL